MTKTTVTMTRKAAVYLTHDDIIIFCFIFSFCFDWNSDDETRRRLAYNYEKEDGWVALIYVAHICATTCKNHITNK